MQLSIQREALLKPLQQVAGVVERRQTLPILANLLVRVEQGELTLTGTDLEVEMTARTTVESAENGETTLPARKLFDIVRALPEGVRLQMKLNGDRMALTAGRSRFTLATLPASEFPVVEQIELLERIAVPEERLLGLIQGTAFAMANQDVRYYLNGMLIDLQDARIRCVATDGHRLALQEAEIAQSVATRRQIIVPRKGVNELAGLLQGGEGEVQLELGRNHLRVRRDEVTFTSKLIDGRFPDYEAVIPLGADKTAILDREGLRGALQRAAILSNEKYRGVRLELSPGRLRVIAHNPEQEEAIEEIEAQTMVDDLAVGFNVGYLLDALGALRHPEVKLHLRDAQSSCLIQDSDNAQARHVVMPLRL